VNRACRMLLERDVAEIERRLALYRANSSKRIAQDLGVHLNTVTTINLGRHAVQQRLRRDYQHMLTALVRDAAGAL
jgi:FixJ family two-component response regulator